MKLELARAMLYHADLLLLDEVRLVFESTARFSNVICDPFSPRTT
jgi:ABC-type branched-subunit amino acid transport system ATPase component